MFCVRQVNVVDTLGVHITSDVVHTLYRDVPNLQNAIRCYDTHVEVMSFMPLGKVLIRAGRSGGSKPGGFKIFHTLGIVASLVLACVRACACGTQPQTNRRGLHACIWTNITPYSSFCSCTILTVSI